MQARIKKALLIVFLLSAKLGYTQSDFDSQIKKMSDTLVNRLLMTGKKRITVSNFVDLQGNVTELGKYISEAFSVELSNTDLNVVDRSRLKDLLNELKLTEEKLTKPENALKLGELAGVEYIITGTTVMLDNTIDITIKALDIQNGTSIAGQRGSIPRTDAINNLMRNSLGESNIASGNVNAGKKIELKDRSATDYLFEIGISDLRKVECEVYNSEYGKTLFCGQACFENQTDYDLILTVPAPSSTGIIISEKILIPKGGRNCSPRIAINRYNWESTIKDITFNFTTANISPEKRGTFIMTIEKCKIKSVVLTKKNIYFEN